MARLHVTSKIHPGQKCRIHTWIDTSRLVELFGIEAKVGNSYCHVLRDGKPLLFESRAECAASMLELSRG